MKRLKIAIDPLLKKRFGPEVCWTLRLLLSSIGFAWEEVPTSAVDCDIAYSSELGETPPSRIRIPVTYRYWEDRARSRLQSVGKTDDWSFPIFHGEEHCSKAAHFLAGRLNYRRDILFDIFWLVTGQEECHWPKNQHGYLDLTGTVFQQENVLNLALASSIGAGLEGYCRQLGFPPPLPRWPHGKTAAAGVGHDVDYPEVIRWLEPAHILYRRGARGLKEALSILIGEKHHWHFSSWVDIEKSMGTSSAFYFVPVCGSLLRYAGGTPDPFYDIGSQRFRDLFNYLAGEGCEIGMQASYRAFESRERFAAEKHKIEEISGQPVYGNRHHYWHLNPEDPESTLQLHEQVGLTYDTSLAHDRYIGWRRGVSWPFFPFHQRTRRELNTLQLSTSWMDNQLFGFKGHNPGSRKQLLQSLVETTAAQGGCLLIDLHEYVFDSQLYPGWVSSYQTLWEDLVKRSDYWIDTPARLANHWRARYSSLLHASQGLWAVS
jgi:hypothetical protein